MVYLYYGAPGDDAREADVADIVGVYYDLDHATSETDFDASAAAADFAETVRAVNSAQSFCVY